MPFEQKDTRVVAGLMSGTSLDGVDVALARITGTGIHAEIELIDFVFSPYSEELRGLLLKNAQPASSSVLEISQLNVRLAHLYADAVRAVLKKAGCSLTDLDAIGCHGQTIYHVPEASSCAGKHTRSTLQIGDPSTLANLLSTVVVGDFRLADMAVGGQGAPLVPYFDYVCFSHLEENRVLLNIGGIGNLTVLPAGGAVDEVTAFDTGPGNMLIDALMKHFWEKAFDEGGQMAARGTPDGRLSGALLEDPYYNRMPPKSTGREYFNQGYVDKILNLAGQLKVNAPEDILATVTLVTVESIVRAYNNFIAPKNAVTQFIVSGGGVHNDFLMRNLQQQLKPVQVRPMHEFGLDPDAKEALCFALLAHETLNGAPSNVPSATGAERPAILGKICLP